MNTKPKIAPVGMPPHSQVYWACLTTNNCGGQGHVASSLPGPATLVVRHSAKSYLSQRGPPHPPTYARSHTVYTRLYLPPRTKQLNLYLLRISRAQVSLIAQDQSPRHSPPGPGPQALSPQALSTKQSWKLEPDWPSIIAATSSHR